jgi:uncharacterized protein
VPFLAGALLLEAASLAARIGLVVPDSVSGTIMYAAYAAWLLYRAARPPYDIELGALSWPPERRSDWKLLWIVIPLVVVSAGAFYVVTLALSFVAPRVAAELLAPDPTMEKLTLRMLPNDLVESATGAIAEEWLFRGALLRVWTERFGLRFAVLGTSLVFAAMHADVVGSLIFGIVMAALYVRTGTLVVPIVVHLVFNAVVTVVVLALGEGPTTIASLRQYWWAGTAAFAVGLAAIVPTVRRIAPWPWRLPDASGRALAPPASRGRDCRVSPTGA